MAGCSWQPILAAIMPISSPCSPAVVLPRSADEVKKSEPSKGSLKKQVKVRGSLCVDLCLQEPSGGGGRCATRGGCALCLLFKECHRLMFFSIHAILHATGCVQHGRAICESNSDISQPKGKAAIGGFGFVRHLDSLAFINNTCISCLGSTDACGRSQNDKACLPGVRSGPNSGPARCHSLPR